MRRGKRRPSPQALPKEQIKKSRPGGHEGRKEKIMSEQDIIRKVKLLREMQRMAEDAMAEAEALKDEIKAYMGNNEELRAGEYKITWKQVKSSRIDTRALAKAMPDVAEAFTKETMTRRFLVA